MFSRVSSSMVTPAWPVMLPIAASSSGWNAIAAGGAPATHNASSEGFRPFIVLFLFYRRDHFLWATAV
jgi:hypothetical protein